MQIQIRDGKVSDYVYLTEGGPLLFDDPGEFSAVLDLSRVERGRSAMTFWFDVVENTSGLPINHAPMRYQEFEKVLFHKNIQQGRVHGRFRFNKRGVSISLELVS